MLNRDELERQKLEEEIKNLRFHRTAETLKIAANGWDRNNDHQDFGGTLTEGGISPPSLQHLGS